MHQLFRFAEGSIHFLNYYEEIKREIFRTIPGLVAHLELEH